ncbi:MAG: DoxX family protein [Candidatus Omnitrophica bacterium]|nr:DoxX family protein [Candidatus Omnitrophota bacterium]
MSATQSDRLRDLLLRFVLGGVFAYAGFMKLTEPSANFAAALEQYLLLPRPWIPVLARLLPWAEWIGGMFLLLGFMIRSSAALLGALSAGFVAAISWNLLHGKALENCGCFGSGRAVLTPLQVYLMDWLNCVIGIFLAGRGTREWSLDALLQRFTRSKSA